MEITAESEYLRGLARQVRAIADQPVMAERQRLWREHNALRGRGPLVLCFPEGAWQEILPQSALLCQDEFHRELEWSFRHKIWWWEHINDDNFLLPFCDLGWRVNIGNYGFDVPFTQADNRGSYVWDAPIKDLAAELPKLHFRSLSVDRERTRLDLKRANEMFGDILPPRLRSLLLWSVGMTWEAAKLVGLENLMYLMADQPEQVHRLMTFLRDEHMHLITSFEQEGLLTPNNSTEYVGSGGVGCTDQLQPRTEVGCKLSELWGFGESQETVGISPAMFEEFVLPYQIPLLDKFGLNYYGCCEGLEHRIDSILKHVPRLRRVSVAPSANQEVLAGKLAGHYVYCRKVYPAHVSVDFNEPAIRADLRHTLRLTHGKNVELILKDTHTVQNDPTRITRWVQIARQEIEGGLL